MSEPIHSTSEKRVENNVMRHEYKVLSEHEKQYMQRIKDAGLAFHDLCSEIGLAVGAPNNPPGSRELSLAKTKIEEAVMWAVKHITR